MKQRRPQPAPTAGEESQRPGYISNWVFALSLIIGLALGLSITRLQGPLQRGAAEPWQLRPSDRRQYMLAIALEHRESGDVPRALAKLIALRPAGDPLEALAEGACALGSRGYLSSGSAIKAVRYAVELYTSQGREGCAEMLLPPADMGDVASTEATRVADPLRPTPPPTKAPLQEAGNRPTTLRIVPTLPVERAFEGRPVRSFCDLSRPAIIEVYVVDYLGRGIPGQRIRARWGDREDIFLSGLKQDRGDAYADFQMEKDIDYSIDMPGAAAALSLSLRTGVCYSGNRESLKSYRVTFVET